MLGFPDEEGGGSRGLVRALSSSSLHENEGPASRPKVAAGKVDGSLSPALLLRSPSRSALHPGGEEGPPPVLVRAAGRAARRTFAPLPPVLPTHPSHPPQSVLSRLLCETVGRNEKLESASGAEGGRHSLFCGTRAPAVALDAYLARIFRYANCSPACYVLAFIYLERLVAADPRLRVTALSVHRLISTCVLVATKFLDDSYYNNCYFAKIVGISLGEMNALELELLGRLDFRLHCQPEEFDACCQRLAEQLSEEELLEAAEELEVSDELRAAREESALTATA